MPAASLIVAWSTIRFDAGDKALICYLIGGWLASAALAVINPWLIWSLNSNARSRLSHLAIFAEYASVTVVMIARWPSRLQGRGWSVPLLGIPIVAIVHFAALIWTRRQNRLRTREIDDGT